MALIPLLIILAIPTDWIVGLTGPGRWLKHFERGESLIQAGQYAEAEEELERSLRLAEKYFDPPHTNTADNLHYLGIAYSEQRKLGEAESNFLRALDMGERVFEADEEDKFLAGPLSYLTQIYYLQDRYADHKRLAEWLLAIHERSGKPDDRRVAAIAYNLALSCLYLNPPIHFDEAEGHLLRALEIEERILSADDPALMNSRYALWDLYMEQGRLEDAEKLSNRPD